MTIPLAVAVKDYWPGWKNSVEIRRTLRSDSIDCDERNRGSWGGGGATRSRKNRTSRNIVGEENVVSGLCGRNSSLFFFFFLRGLKDKTRGYIALTRVNVSGALVGGKCISVSFLK